MNVREELPSTFNESVCFKRTVKIIFYVCVGSVDPLISTLSPRIFFLY